MHCSVVPTLFGYFLGFHPYMFFHFYNGFPVTCSFVLPLAVIVQLHSMA